MGNDYKFLDSESAFVGFEKNEYGKLFFRASNDNDWIALPDFLKEHLETLDYEVELSNIYRILRSRTPGTAEIFRSQILSSNTFSFRNLFVEAIKEKLINEYSKGESK